MSQLLITKGPNVGVTYDLGDRTRIGRLGENEIQVPDPNVSRIHAEISKENGQFVISDRGSKNGVIVNGQEVADKELEPGDKILIGGATFLFDGNIEIHNARFSNNSIYYVPRLKEISKKTLKEDGSGKDEKPLELIEIARIFDNHEDSLPAWCEHVCEGFRKQLKADNCILFIKEHPESELLPYEAVPHNVPIRLDSKFVKQFEKQRNPVELTVSLEDAISADIDHIEEDFPAVKTPIEKPTSVTPNVNLMDHHTVKVTGDKPITLLGAPIISGNALVGVLLATTKSKNGFASGSLSMIQAAAAIIPPIFQALRIVDTTRNSSHTKRLNSEDCTASTRSLRMQEIYNSAKRSADSEGTILISGESGTGKETLACFIHESGARHTGPFIVVNCSTIPTDEFETVLFGQQQDSNENDSKTKTGKVEQAIGGTLLLQEVGDLDLALQPKLLRFLQDRAFYRMGSTNAIKADIRVTATTSVDLAAAVRSGQFREDLWYRLNVVPFHMPPLRERREDIAPLVDFFINKHAGKLNRKVLGSNDSAISLLQKYDWPANICELENAVERAVLLAEGKVLATSDFSHIEEARRRLNSQADLERKRDTKPLAEVERQHIIIALKKHNFNQARAAEALGLHRNTLRNKIIEYGIEIPK